ncbi:MAG: ABC transporter ATP-binding protein [Candidatus Thorarchaeota archaeon]
MLEVQNVGFAYEGQEPILHSVDLRISHGEVVIITGATGSGKSTLAKAICGFIPKLIHGEFSGNILLGSQDISEIPLPELSRRVALVQQDTDSQICTLRVSDEVAFGPENYLVEHHEIAERVTQSLESMRTSHLIDRSTNHLSGGEKQRVVIASLLASRPEYLILDEPSSSLDPKGINSLRKILLDLKKNGIGVVCFEHRLQSVLPVADRVLRLSGGRLSESSDTFKESSADTKQSVSGTPLLTTSDLSFSYGTNPVVKDIDLSMNSGEVIALMGNNGSGKTTLISLLAGLLTPESGKIYLRNRPIVELSRKEIAKQVAVVFQNPNYQIFEKTVWDEQILSLNLLDFDSITYLETAENLLKAADLIDSRTRNPFSLSHGQKRRLSVTSVVAHNPEIYLFDEPFIGQDREGREFITEIMTNKARDGGVCLAATHEPEFAVKYCNRLLFMDMGSIILDGTPESVLGSLSQLGFEEYLETGGYQW